METIVIIVNYENWCVYKYMYQVKICRFHNKTVKLTPNAKYV